MANAKVPISEEKLRSLLKVCCNCPVCKQVMLEGFPPLKCKSNHRVCKKCFQSSIEKPCPQCESTKPQNKNKEENILHCRYKTRGCGIVLQKGQCNHESECRYRDYICFGQFTGAFKCPWSGLQEGLIQHFQTAHKQNYGNMGVKYTGYINLNVKGFVQMFQAYNKQFICVYERKSPLPCSSFIYIACIATEKQAEKYCYDLEFFKPGDLVRTVRYREKCVSDALTPAKVLGSGQCIVVCDNTLKKLFMKDQLHMRFWIKQVHEVVSAKNKDPK